MNDELEAGVYGYDADLRGRAKETVPTIQVNCKSAI